MMRPSARRNQVIPRVLTAAPVGAKAEGGAGVGAGELPEDADLVALGDGAQDLDLHVGQRLEERRVKGGEGLRADDLAAALEVPDGVGGEQFVDGFLGFVLVPDFSRNQRWARSRALSGSFMGTL